MTETSKPISSLKSWLAPLLKAEIMLGFGALVVGACALVVSLYEARVIRLQQSTAVWPYLHLGDSNVGDRYTAPFSNFGLGPAVIKSARLYYDGQPLRSWNALNTLIEEPAGNDVISFPLSGMVLSEKVNMPLVSVPNTDEYVLFKRAISQTRFDICYCSLLNECWRYEGRVGAHSQTRTRLRDACEADPEHEFFQ